MLVALGKKKNKILGHIFYVFRRWSEKPLPPHKICFPSSNGLEITLECLICVQQGLFLSWDQYLV